MPARRVLNPHRCAGQAEQIRLQKGGEEAMATYKILRIYKMEATSVSQATKRLLDAVEAHKEEDFHVSDTVREDDEPGTDKPAGIGSIVKRQLTGR
jgi:hypothetical protein